MKQILYCLLGLALLMPTRAPFGYEDQTHQALTRQAVKIATQNGVPANFFTDDQVKAIIDGAGEGPGARGGGGPVATDGEDYTRYRILHCKEVKPQVTTWEPLNHFAGGMAIGGPAADRFVQFYQDAVNLWRKGNRKDAAFILGRALHLVEDMAQPQHASDEAHPDKCYFGYGPQLSFLEEFTEAQINGMGLCPERGDSPPRVYPGLIGKVSEYESLWRPLQALIEMEAPGYTEGVRYKGYSFTASRLNDWYPSPQPLQALCTPEGQCIDLMLPFQFSDGGHQLGSCGTRIYSPGQDYMGSGTQGGTTLRIDMGMKLEEGKVETAAFADKHISTLLSPCIGYASGLIVYFWNEVKDSCGGSSARESSGTCLTCFADKPSGESPDDSVGVKTSSARTESAAVPVSDDWHDLCRVGIAKGLPAMADYGVSSALMDQLAALDPNGDPAVAQALYDRLEALEGKYSGPQNLMPQEVAKAPQVAVWEKGFGDSARSLVEAMREPVTMLEEPQEPVFTGEEELSRLPSQRGLLDADPAKQRILIRPMDSMYCRFSDFMESQVPSIMDEREMGGAHV